MQKHFVAAREEKPGEAWLTRFLKLSPRLKEHAAAAPMV
jgi:hypothetical protein